MTSRGLGWCVLALLGAGALGACMSGRGDTVTTPAPQEAPVIRPDAGTPGCATCGPRERCVEGRCVCQPLDCLSLGQRCGQVGDGCGGVLDCGRCSRCGPQEMDCCGVCLPKAEKRCPDNVHCPTADPEK
jgi:hypothetical protein